MRWCAVVMLVGLVACGRLGYDTQRRLDAVPPDVAIDMAIDVAIDVAPDVPAVCPVDTAPLSTGSQVCIELAERGTIPWTDAVIDCASIGRRLCADAEWFEGCVNATGLVDMIDGGYEWVAEEAAGIAQKRGATDCTVMSTHVVTDPYEYRCCMDL